MSLSVLSALTEASSTRRDRCLLTTALAERSDVCMYHMYEFTICMYHMYVCTICMYNMYVCMYVCMYSMYVCEPVILIF